MDIKFQSDIIIDCNSNTKIIKIKLLMKSMWNFGALGESRTPTSLPIADFESAASTNSATRAYIEYIFN